MCSSGRLENVTDPEQSLDALVAVLLSARAPLFFTGAGISTASGIDDFRSPCGVWSRMKPIEFADFLADEAVRLEDWRRRFRFAREFAAAQPNVAHRFVERWMGERGHLITQNIDGLHARAGAAPSRTAELHGSGVGASCLECGVPYDLNDLERRIATTGRAPICDRCEGVVKANVVSFGQPMPEAVMLRAQDWCREADLMVCIGSSLVVNPAARLPLVAKRTGATLVIVNRDPTPLDDAADIRLSGDISEVCVEVGKRLDGEVGEAP